MGRFELDFLDEHTDEALLTEIQRVSAAFSGGSLSKRIFDTLSGRVSASTICKRFGGWKEALETAGVAQLYNGRPITEKVRKNRVSRAMSEADLVHELQRVQSIVGKDALFGGRVLPIVCNRSRHNSWEIRHMAEGVGSRR